MKMFVCNALLLITVSVLVGRTSGDCNNLGSICKSGKFMRDPDNCNQFCQCAHSRWYQKRCPRGLYFDEEHNVCNWPDQSLMCDPPQGLCNPNPCQNGGTCMSKRMGYTCDCPPGYGGSDCNLNTTCQRYTCPENVTSFNYPDWQDQTCSSYFECRFGRLQRQQCRGNSVFSFMLLRCVQPAELEFPCSLNFVDSAAQ